MFPFTNLLDPSLLLTLTRASLQTSHRANGFNVTMYPAWYKEISMEWTVPSSWGNVLFNVYFSPVEDAEFEKLNTQPLSANFFVDTETREYSKFAHGFYVIEAILRDRGDITVRSDPMTWQTGQRRWVQLRSIEIQRREYWLLSRFNGAKSYIFRRKTFGKRCPICWNTKLEKVMDDHCPNCLGTSFDGGYFEPAPLYINYFPTNNNQVDTYYGKQEPDQQAGGWTISMPEIRPRDVIVRTSDWNMYVVENMTPTELQTHTVKQTIALTQLSKSTVEYKLVERNLPEFKTREQLEA